MKRPFDEDFMNIMTETAKFLCEEIQGCKFGYVQSDEISLLLTDFDNITTDSWFDGNIQKIVSVSASMAAAYFNKELVRLKFGKLNYPNPEFIQVMNVLNSPLAFFDSRVWIIPDPTEVENYFIWRQKDAVRNSIAMTAQSLYSHKELTGKSSSEQQEMIFQKGQNWNDMPEGFKRGRTISKSILENNDVSTKTEWIISTPDFNKRNEIGGREITQFIPLIS